LAEKSPRDEVVLNYDSLNPFVLCATSFAPIYKGNPVLTCSFCQASYSPDKQDSLCTVCGVAKVGATVSGLKWMPEQR
jgi:coatomer protein complex subunit alpha (xenin)